MPAVFSYLTFLLLLSLSSIVILTLLNKLKRSIQRFILLKIQNKYIELVDSFTIGSSGIDKIKNSVTTVKEKIIVADMLLERVYYFTGETHLKITTLLEDWEIVDKCIIDLNDGNKWKKCRSADKLGKIKSYRSFDALIESMLNSDDIDVCFASARALGSFNTPSAIKPLLSILYKLDEYKAERIVEIILKIRFSEDDEEIMSHLLSLLAKDDWKTRLWTTIILGDLRILKASFFIEKLLKDKDEKVREAAASSLGKIGDPSNFRSLTLALTDPSWKVRKAAATALGNLNNPAAIPNLTIALMDRNWEVNSKAIESLIKLDSPDFINTILLLNSQNYFVRIRAAEALELCGVLDKYIGFLADSDKKKSSEIIDVLYNAAKNRAVTPLLSNKTNKNKNIRNAINDILSKINKNE